MRATILTSSPAGLAPNKLAIRHSPMALATAGADGRGAAAPKKRQRRVTHPEWCNEKAVSGELRSSPAGVNGHAGGSCSYDRIQLSG